MMLPIFLSSGSCAALNAHEWSALIFIVRCRSSIDNLLIHQDKNRARVANEATMSIMARTTTCEAEESSRRGINKMAFEQLSLDSVI